ncbi:MAG: 4Fe-4S binding protein [Thermotogaceae bacterium]|nr:4Fe-4S binding protein [Thermotogaceae bacterium]
MRNVITTELTKLRRQIYIKLLQKIISGKYNEIPKISKEIIKEGNILQGQNVYKMKITIDETIKIILGTNYSKTKDLELYEIVPEMEAILKGESPLMNKSGKVINIIREICDGCPLPSYHITNMCRNCSAKYCINSCPRNAIVTTDKRPEIDLEKCVGCGLCAKNCPYGAIIKIQRPCVFACAVGATCSDENGFVLIDDEKCVQCGECAVACPFGAIVESSSISQVAIRLGKEPMVAIFAPASVSQFGPKVSLGQFKRALKEVGFADALEVAIGADMVAKEEAEYIEKNLDELSFITTSCCPAFKRMIETRFPEVVEHISPSLSPMNMLAKKIKEDHPNAKVVFIGPCIAKKYEVTLGPYTDYALTYEEIASMFAVEGIEPSSVEEEELDNATPYGRFFAISGGVAEAVRNFVNKEFETVVCSGLKECIHILKKAKKGEVKGLIEGMSCEGGCISGTRVMVNPRIAMSNLRKLFKIEEGILNQ